MTFPRPIPRAPRPRVLDEDARAELRREAAGTPEWSPWLRLVEAALAGADDDAWRAIEVRFAPARPADAPLLEGARIGVDPVAAADLVARLLAVAGGEAGSPSRAGAPLDALGVLEAGIRGDRGRLGRLAEASGLPVPVLATVAHYACQPVLLEAAHRAAGALPADWSAGYCPVCGAWPAHAELRGLDRSRVLRCGRCATGWSRAVLHCAFCEERDHRRQGSLVPEQGGELLRVETCDGCQGYLKVLTTLRARPAATLPLDDLRSVPLELRAVERGYRRPDGLGRAPGVAVSPRAAVSAGGGG